MGTTRLPTDFAEFLRSLRSNGMLLDGEPVFLPSLADLRRNKAASGRPKDLEDLRHLPDPSRS